MRALGHVITKKHADDLELTLLLDFDGECDFPQFSKLVSELKDTNVTKRDLGAAIRMSSTLVLLSLPAQVNGRMTRVRSVCLICLLCRGNR